MPSVLRYLAASSGLAPELVMMANTPWLTRLCAAVRPWAGLEASSAVTSWSLRPLMPPWALTMLTTPGAPLVLVENDDDSPPVSATMSPILIVVAVTPGALAPLFLLLPLPAVVALEPPPDAVVAVELLLFDELPQAAATSASATAQMTILNLISVPPRSFRFVEHTALHDHPS